MFRRIPLALLLAALLSFTAHAQDILFEEQDRETQVTLRGGAWFSQFEHERGPDDKIEADETRWYVAGSVFIPPVGGYATYGAAGGNTGTTPSDVDASHWAGLVGYAWRDRVLIGVGWAGIRTDYENGSQDLDISGWAFGGHVDFPVSTQDERFRLFGTGLFSPSANFDVGADEGDGDAWFFEGGASYQFAENFGVEAGYRYASANGTVGQRDHDLRLQGFFVGGRLTF